MANNVVEIDTHRVNQAGADIIEQGTKMYNALKDIQDIVNGTKKCFKSEGGDATRVSFNTSAEKFEEFKKFIHEYGQFLQDYSGMQVSLDSKIDSLAAQIPKL